MCCDRGKKVEKVEKVWKFEVIAIQMVSQQEITFKDRKNDFNIKLLRVTDTLSIKGAP